MIAPAVRAGGWPCSLSLTAALLANVASDAHAQGIRHNWSAGGGADTRWSSVGNWDVSSVPAPGDDVYIGNSATLQTVRLDGTRQVGLFYLGTGGSATLDFDAAASLQTNISVLANSSASQVTMNLAGGQSWTDTSLSVIGNFGRAQVSLSDASSFNGSQVYLGSELGAHGTLHLRDRASATLAALEIGASGTGVLDAADKNTLVRTGSAVLATGAGSSGSATLSNQAQWVVANQLTVGSQGAGSVNVASGAQLSSLSQVTMGLYAGSRGEITVSGQDSSFSASGALFVGARGTGLITIEDQGAMIAGDTVLGRGGSANGGIVLKGAGTTMGVNTLTIGGDRTDTGAVAAVGRLDISGGAKASAGQVRLGDAVNASGTLSVTGAGSSLASSDRISVGYAGTGSLVMDSGATLTTQGVLIGHEAGSSGTATLDGPGTRLGSSGVVYVGNVGNGSLQMSSGARLDSTDGYVATEHGSNSSAALSGGAAWVNSGDFFVGHNAGASGATTVAGGARVESRYGILGDLNGARGMMRITGAGSLWQTSSDMNVGRLGQGEMTLTDGGTARAPVIYIANNAGSRGVLNVGAAAGDAPASAGVLDTPRVHLGAGDGRLVFNFAGAPLIYGGNIAGQGAVDLYAGDLVLTGRSTNTGLTAVRGGSLTVNGRLAGPVEVLAGGVLGGNGTVGPTTVASGAVLAPGNSIGTLTVNGDLRLAAGSVYRVEAQPAGTQSDRVDVRGTAYLGGSVLHVGPQGNFTPNLRYTILTANAFSGRFDSVTSAYAFLDPTLSYDGGAINLQLDQTRSFASAGVTGNQRAVGAALDSLPAGHALGRYVSTLPAGQPQAVFDSLSGEAHASVSNSLARGASTVRALPTARLRANLQAGLLPGAPTAQAGGALMPQGALPSSAALPAWAELVGGWQTFDGDGNAAPWRQHTGGVFVGADRPVGAGWRLGGAVGFTDTKTKVDDRSSQADIGGYSALVYGGKSFAAANGAWNLLGGAGYTWHDISTRRQAASQADALTADYGASTVQLFSELSYSWAATAGLTLEPYAGLAWSDLRIRGFRETGGAAALTGQASRQQQTQTALGLRARQDVEWGGRQGWVTAMLGWRHAFGDVDAKTQLAFDASQPFTVAGTPIARDAALLGLGADMALGRNSSVGLSYDGQFARDSREHAASVRVAWRF
ncbi:autotransporter domain-containing protein [Achromobacter spanius]|uniref:autotransporter domain-containing protein n=1 Tax=Achromobacter spanius TaxID=217203 RepID=UPI003208F345